MNCRACGAANDSQNQFCVSCGALLASAAGEAPRACFRCGAALPPQGNFCPSCGTPQQSTAPPRPVCIRCGFTELTYFHNFRGSCNRCRHIFAWSYLPGGGIVVYEPQPFDF